MKKVAFYTLGCKVNQYETDAMNELFRAAGYEIVDFNEAADVYIINTCTVTNIADRKSRQILHRAKKKNPSAIVAAAGCYAQEAGEKLLEDPMVDIVVGNNKKKDIVGIVENYMKQAGKDSASALIDINHTPDYETLSIHETSEHRRAYIKIQDGCNQFCSYCIIPYARGRVRSRQPEDIIDEVRHLTENDYREIVLTGIHISSYGLDFEGVEYDSKKNNGSHLIALIEALAKNPGLERIRLSSLEPRLMTEDFVKRLSVIDKICPHFHLSLQSGCDATLKRMNRKYTTEEYMASCVLLRKYFDRPAITTDVIVGFPGETEEEFEMTKRFIEEVAFAQMHIFKYSKRRGTKAAVMENQIDEQIKNLRSAELFEIDEKLRRRYIDENMDKTLLVLAEEMIEIDDSAYMTGHSKEYIKVVVPGTDSQLNTVVSGKMTDKTYEDFVICESMD